ncbi:MAG: hypothetical protein D6722_09800 [Bacteroidetes bacterium]|nr:MAG: hypothetical protein D6722_09800 [Bacteroidota bacterium]
MIYPEYLTLRLALTPLILGIVVVACDAPAIHDRLGRSYLWMREKHALASREGGWWRTLFVQPFLWLGFMGDVLARKVPVPRLHDGLGLVLALYAWAGLLGLMLGAVSLLVTLVVALVSMVVQLILFLLGAAFGIAVIYQVIKQMFWEGSEVQRSYESSRRMFGGGEARASRPVLGTFRPGTRVNQETGRIQEETAFGFFDTDERVNTETGVIQEGTAFGFFDTDIRIHPETGEIEERSALGWFATGKRVHSETGVIQEQNAFGWFDTDERIHPQTGRHQKRDAFGWWDD